MEKKPWLQRVRRLRLVVRRAVATLQTGARLSVFKGSGLAFEEVRHYQPGDDVRAIDWNVTARMGHPYVKRFVEERELRIHFVLDISGSQQIGSAWHQKRDVAAETIALLSLAGLRQSDSLGLVTFTDQIESVLPPRKGMRHALRLIYQALYADAHKQRTNLAHALTFVSKTVHRRSVIIVLSDFLDNNWQASLDRLAHRHDVYAIRTSHSLDQELPASGLFTLHDAETGETRLYHARPQQAPIQPAPRNKQPIHWINLKTDGQHVQVLLHSLQQLRRQRHTSR